MVLPISEESYCMRITALAPMAVAFLIMRSMAWRRASSRSSVYSVISPPPRERRPAMMLPPRPRLRTTRPKTWPFISTIRCPVTSSVVTTIIFPSPRWLEPSLLLRDAGRLGAVADLQLLNRGRQIIPNRALREKQCLGDLRDAGAALTRDQDLALA